MTERKFTDEEVIKALECCANGECDECPYQESSPCKEYLNNAALDLIKFQKHALEEYVKVVDFVMKKTPLSVYLWEGGKKLYPGKCVSRQDIYHCYHDIWKLMEPLNHEAELLRIRRSWREG